jgi:post-segregation antitoxin (ccd killing protein)
MAKTSVTIPDDIFEQAKELSDNFSALVTEAVSDLIRKKKIEKAQKSFGKWAKRDKDSVDIVNELRSEDGRTYARRSR